MNSDLIKGIVRFAGLVLLQVLLFNRMNLFGLINPFVYILFLYWYPIRENRSILIGIAFLLGFAIDLFFGHHGHAYCGLHHNSLPQALPDAFCVRR